MTAAAVTTSYMYLIEKKPPVGCTECAEMIAFLMKCADLGHSCYHRHRHGVRSVTRLKNNVCRAV